MLGSCWGAAAAAAKLTRGDVWRLASGQGIVNAHSCSSDVTETTQRPMCGRRRERADSYSLLVGWRERIVQRSRGWGGHEGMSVVLRLVLHTRACVSRSTITTITLHCTMRMRNGHCSGHRRINTASLIYDRSIYVLYLNFKSYHIQFFLHYFITSRGGGVCMECVE